MKINRLTLIFLFFALTSCSFSAADASTSTPVPSQLAVVTDLANTTPYQSTSTPVLTETPMPTLTTSPSPTPTLPIDDIVERLYNPDEWKALYDKTTIWNVELDPAERMWISPGAEVGYFDGSQWVFFSPKDYMIFPFNFDMEIAPDGTVWLSRTHVLSRYKDGRWETFPIPDADEIVIPNMTIDASGVVWVIMSSCPDHEVILRKCDGKKWSDVQLWKTTITPKQILFTPDGALWAVGNTGDIGRYDGTTWKIYSETDLWLPEDWIRFTLITSDPKGNIYGVSSEQSGHASWITKIDTNGKISKIPFPTKLTFIGLALFVDSQDTIWVNACLDDRSDTCLAYYKDDHWVSFTDIPSGRMLDMKELSDGTFLIASIYGLYQFKPEEFISD